MDGGNVLTTDILLVLIMLGGTVVLFVREWMPADVAALLILVVLGLSELVPPEGLFSGFASNAVMSIVAVMILGAGLDRTGVLGGAAKVILRVSGGHEGRLVIALSTAAGVLSIFMQNPAVAALFLPVASRVSEAGSALVVAEVPADAAGDAAAALAAGRVDLVHLS